MEKEQTQTKEIKKEPSKTMIYVSNLPFSATDEQLKGLFDGFAVKTAYIAKRRNGRSKGFGFVNLEKPEDQQKAIEQVNGGKLEERPLTAKVAFHDPRRNEKGELKEEFKKQLQQQTPEPSKTAIYVSNLPFALDDEGLKTVFTDFDVKTATVAKRSNGRSMGFGFVEFTSVEEREKALKLDKKEVDKRPITVKVAKNYLGPNRPKRKKKRSRFPRSRFNSNNNYQRQRPQRPQQPQRNPETTLYVANLPFDLDGNDLKEIFAEFNVKEANIATYRDGRSRGFGFVEFFNSKSQKDALEALDQSEVNKRVITVRIARGRQQRRPPRVVRRKKENKPREPSKTLVYVSNLPFSKDDKGLAELFKGFDVVKAYVAKRRNGRSKGFGFVDFASNEQQQKALSECKELESEGRKLNVQVANKVVPKEETEQTEETNQN